MKQFLFLTTHLGSGSKHLFDALNSSPRIQMQQTDTDYDHPSVVYDYFKKPSESKLDRPIYGEQLLFDFSLSHKGYFKFAKFIYFIRNGRHAINEMVHAKKFSIPDCLLYYTYRMRRICEMARQTPGAIVLTWDNLRDGKGMDLVSQYLGLKYTLEIQGNWEIPPTSKAGSAVLQKAEDCYERHHYLLKQFDLQRVN